MRGVRVLTASAALLLLVFAGGCVSIDIDYSTDRHARVNHVVLCWLKDPDDKAVRQQIVEASEGFRSIPGVLDVRIGKALPSARTIVDDSFDIGIVVVCRDAEALQEYLDHPQHAAAARTLIRPAARKILVYDIVE